MTRRIYETITNLRALCRDAGARDVGTMSDRQVLHYARLVTGINLIAIDHNGGYLLP